MLTYHALDSSVCGPHELHQGGLVVHPLSLQAEVASVRFWGITCSTYQVSGIGYKVSGIPSRKQQISGVKVFMFHSFSPLLWWVLVAAELKGDLKVIGAKVVEVLHSATHRVPDHHTNDHCEQ